MEKKHFNLFFLVSIVVLFDYLTKRMVVEALNFQHSHIITSFFNIVHIHNAGVSFGMLKQWGEVGRYTLIVLASLLSLLIYYLWHKSLKKLERNSYALILGGAIGNIIDRVQYGYVIDFLDFHFMGYHWPAFNIADSAIVSGVMLILSQEIWQFYKNKGVP